MSVPASDRPVTGLPAVTASFRSGLPVVAGFTLLSRVLGLVRDAATAGVFGAGPVLDAFTVAFRVPNLARRLFGEGALTAAFLPVLVRTRRRDAGAADRLASAVIFRLAAGLTGGVLAGELLLGGAAFFFTEAGSDGRLLCGLTAALLPYVVPVCVVAALAAVLHAANKFAAPAAVPCVLNVAWLAGLGVAAWVPDPRAAIYAVAAAVLAAGAVQVAVLLPGLRAVGFRPRWDAAARRGAGVRGELRAVGTALVPVLFGLSVTQLNALLDALLAWGLAAPAGGSAEEFAFGLGYPLRSGAASALYFGQRLYQFPLGVFGVALGTVLFPRLAAHAARGDRDAVAADLTGGLRLCLFVGVPAAAGLAVVAGPLTALLLGRGAFDADDVARTAAAVTGYGAAVPFACGLLLAQRGFYALDDRLTPVRVGLLAVAVNLAADAALLWPLGTAGLAWATTLATAVQCVVTVALLRGPLPAFRFTPLLTAAAKATAGTAAMAAAALFVRRAVEPAGSDLLTVAATVAVAVAVYSAAAAVLRMREVWAMVRREGP